MNGYCGVVKGVVMPLWSMKTMPKPLRITVFVSGEYAKPTRGPKLP